MSRARRPNVLLLFTDQHRLSGVGCYGPTPCRTPHIDRLADAGVRFETAYTTCPVCSPARGTIMTGQYPHAHGICSNVHNLGCAIHELADRPELLSRRLQACGYRCGYSGKWHLGTDMTTTYGGPNTPSLPKDVGFEGQNFPGHGGGGFAYPEYRQYLADHGFEHLVTDVSGRAHVVCPYGVLEGPVESTVPYFLAENTIRMIDRFAGTDQPFFIWQNFWGPHAPYYSPREFYDLYRDVDIPEWPNYRWDAQGINGPHQVKVHEHAAECTWDDWAEGVRHYYAFTTLIDQQIGRIVDHLDRTGAGRDTVVIFTADHGETLGSHGGLYDKGWHHFEEIQRIPFIIRPADGLLDGPRAPGDVLPEWASLLDVYPTVLDLAGADTSALDVPGQSLVPLLRGEPVAWRDEVFVEFNGVNSLATSMASVRRGNWKYGWNCSNRDELYDLDADPYETTNRATDPACAQVLADLRKRMDQWMVEQGYPGRGTYRRSRLGGT